MYLLRQLYQYFDDVYFSASLGTYEYFDFKKTATTLLVLVGGLCLGMMVAAIAAVIQKKHVGKFIRGLLKAKAHDADSAKTLEELGLGKSGLVKHEISRVSTVRKLIAVVEDGKTLTYKEELAAAFPEYAAEIRAAAEKAEREAAAEKAKAEAETASASEPFVSSEQEETKAEAETEEATESKENAEDAAEESTSADKTAEQAEAANGAGKSKKKKGAKAFFFERSFRPHRPDFSKARFFIPEELAYRAELRYAEKGNSWFAVVIAFFLLLAVFLLCLRFIPSFVGMLDQSIVNIAGHK